MRPSVVLEEHFSSFPLITTYDRHFGPATVFPIIELFFSRNILRRDQQK